MSSRLNDLLLVSNQNIVAVDDDEVMIDFLKITLTNSLPKCQIKFFTNMNSKFCDYITKNKVDLFILDVFLQNQNAIELTDDIIETHRGQIFLFISGRDPSLELFKNLNGRCIYDYMTKPLEINTFISSVVSLLNISSTNNMMIQNQPTINDLRNHYKGLIERDKLMIKTFKEEIFKNRIKVNGSSCLEQN